MLLRGRRRFSVQFEQRGLDCQLPDPSPRCVLG
jgi:hypothetical protein